MDFIMNIFKGFLSGFFDSFRGFLIAFKLDNELKARKLRRQLSTAQSNTPHRSTGSTNKSNRASCGENDSSRETTPLRTHEEKTVRSRILMCSAFNGGFITLSLYFFYYVFLRLVYFAIYAFKRNPESMELMWAYTEGLLDITFRVIWIAPLFAISKIINNLWFQDIAQVSYKYSQGRSTATQSLSKTIADFIFSTVVETLFLLQANWLSYIPMFGEALYAFHICLLYSLYSFDYRWGEKGWEIHRRLTCIESKWPYFIGFGFPLFCFTHFLTSEWMISGCIFSVIFPCYIISANDANITSETSGQINLFSPMVAITNTIFKSFGKKQTTNKRQKFVQNDK